MSISSRFKESKIGQYWLKYNEKVVLAIGIILIAAVSFEGGYLEGQKNKQESVVVNKVASAESINCDNNQPDAQTTEAKNMNTGSSANATATEKADTPTAEQQRCAFIASKNSNKYHLPTCQWAQKIKPENKICFSSAEEAQKRGYVGAKCCIK